MNSTSSYRSIFLLLNYLFISLPVLVKGVSCPCFSNTTLLFFTKNNTDSLLSCKNETYGIGIWLNKTLQGGWHPFGFHVYDNENEPSCLMEGDIMVRIDFDEVNLCRQLITKRCMDIGYNVTI